MITAFANKYGTRRSTRAAATIVAGIALVAYVVTPVMVAARQPARSVWDGVYSAEQAGRGNAIYTKRCASCHGPELGGHEMAPALSGGTFLSNWDGVTLGDLSDRIRTSMPIDDPGTLSRQQVADVLAYMLSVGRFPTGSADLAKEAELLKQITFRATKP